MNTTRLKLAAIFFAVFWTGWMVWWTSDFDVVHVIMLTIAGSLAALGWYWVMKRWMRWHLERQGH